MLFIIFKLIIFAFLINLCWEVAHSSLYTTCRKMNFKDYRRIMLVMSAKDSGFIAAFYFITVFIFSNIYILNNHFQLTAFIILGIVFSFIDEKISLKLKRWEYAPAMPTIFGVGITPLAEIAATGLMAFYFVFL